MKGKLARTFNTRPAALHLWHSPSPEHNYSNAGGVKGPLPHSCIYDVYSAYLVHLVSLLCLQLLEQIKLSVCAIPKA